MTLASWQPHTHLHTHTFPTCVRREGAISPGPQCQAPTLAAVLASGREHPARPRAPSSPVSIQLILATPQLHRPGPPFSGTMPRAPPLSCFLCLSWEGPWLGLGGIFPQESLSLAPQALPPSRRPHRLFFFFFGCVGSSLLRRLSVGEASGGYSSLRCAGFSLWWLLLLWSTGSRHAGFSSCGSWALERRLSSCGAWASLLRGMWDLPRPGIEPVSPALAGGFLTTAPPGKLPSLTFLPLLVNVLELHFTPRCDLPAVEMPQGLRPRCPHPSPPLRPFVPPPPPKDVS